MFEKFTSEAREAVVAAQKEARELTSSRIEPAHVFVGILASADPSLTTLLGKAGYTYESVRALLADSRALGDRDAQALDSIGIDLDAVRASLEATFGDGVLDAPVEQKRGWLQRRTGHIAFAPGSKKALELALREAIACKDNEIRCEHLVLGLIRGADDSFSAVVSDLGELDSTIRAALGQAAHNT